MCASLPVSGSPLVETGSSGRGLRGHPGLPRCPEVRGEGQVLLVHLIEPRIMLTPNMGPENAVQQTYIHCRKQGLGMG